MCGLGPIQPLLNDKDVTEIMINGCNNLFYENGELFESKQSLTRKNNFDCYGSHLISIR